MATQVIISPKEAVKILMANGASGGEADQAEVEQTDWALRIVDCRGFTTASAATGRLPFYNAIVVHSSWFLEQGSTVDKL